MLSSILERLRDPIKSKFNYEVLEVEDIANAVIASLATPPNVLVSDRTIKLYEMTFLRKN